MRLLHTSDWHLGRTLFQTSLLDEQRRFLDWLLATAQEQRVDAVLVSGDVYDRAVPSLEAVALLDSALEAFSDAGVPLARWKGKFGYFWKCPKCNATFNEKDGQPDFTPKKKKSPAKPKNGSAY